MIQVQSDNAAAAACSGLEGPSSDLDEGPDENRQESKAPCRMHSESLNLPELPTSTGEAFTIMYSSTLSRTS